jgi:hypothetical protein
LEWVVHLAKLVLGSLLAWWSSAYSNSGSLRTAIGFAHVGGLVVGGGCAVAADRLTILAKHWDLAERRSHLLTLRHTHEAVIAGLTVVVLSGLLLLASDPGTFWYSRIFWIKMALVVALMINGAILTRAERRVSSNLGDSWGTLQWTAIASLSLWFLTTFIGTALPNIG